LEKFFLIGRKIKKSFKILTLSLPKYYSLFHFSLSCSSLFQ